jgi:yecA family protein
LRLVFDEPVFENGAQAEDMLGLAMRLYQDIETSLDRPGSFHPVLDFVRNAAGELTVDASAWCQGYRSGMTLCEEQWAMHDGQPLRSLLALIHTLARHPGPLLGALNRELCDQLPQTAEAIYRYWRAGESA